MAANLASGITGTNVLELPGLGPTIDGQLASSRHNRMHGTQILWARFCNFEVRRKTIGHAEM